MSYLFYTRRGRVSGEVSVPPPSGETQTISYTVDNTNDFRNPERGWYVDNNNLGSTVQNAAPVNSVIQYPTLQLHYVNLSAYLGLNTIDSTFLNNLASTMASWRSTGKKAVLRFAYNRDASGTDVSWSRMSGHIDQLAPLWNEYKDVIAVLQAGFIGAWGEMHSSTNGITAANANGKAFVNKIMDVTPEDMTVQFRTTYWLSTTLPNTNLLSADDRFTGTKQARMGHYNDCIGAGDWWITFWGDTPGLTDVQERTYAFNQGRLVSMGGETCDSGGLGAYNDGPRIISDFSACGMDYLHSGYWTNMYTKWQGSGHLAEISRRLGYRLSLLSAELPLTVSSGGSFQVKLTIQNSGFGKVYNPRPIDIIFSAPGKDTITVRLVADARRDLPLGGETKTLTYNATFPSDVESGSYSMQLALPDKSPNLAADERYAIRLANVGLWSTGRNSLNASVSVTGGGGGGNPVGIIGTASISTSLTDYPKSSPTTTGNYYVATTGSDSNNGTSVSTPFATISKALSVVSAGQTILVRAGTYNLSTRININTAWGSNVRLWGYGEERPIIDGSSLGAAAAGRAVYVQSAARKLHMKGFTIRNAPDSGIEIEGQDCVFEDIVAYRNIGTGLHQFGGGSNTYLDCVVLAGGDGTSTDTNVPDGLAFTANTGTYSTGNTLVRCLVANCADDGFDFFRSRQNTVVDCVSIASGRYWNGNTAGDGNGFKLGGNPTYSGQGGQNNFKGCLSVYSRTQGFNNNSSIVANTLTFNTASNSGLGFENATNTVTDNISWSPAAPTGATGSRNSWNLGSSNPQFESDFSLNKVSSPYRTSAVGGGAIGASDVACALFNRWKDHSLVYIPGRGAGAGGTGLPGDTGGAPTVPSEVPSGMYAIAGNGSATLRWEAPPVGVTGMRIERKTSGAFSAIATPPAADRVYNDSSVTNGTTYTYRFAWMNAAGAGPTGGEVVSVPWNELRPLRGNPSFSASSLDVASRVWHDRLLAQLSSPSTIYEYTRNAKDLYSLGRYFMRPVFGALLALRLTGDLRFLDVADYGMQLARAQLADQGAAPSGGDGYRNWVWLQDPGDSTYYNKDIHVMDESLTHAMVCAFAWACAQNRDMTSPGGIVYGERADFWTNYLRNDFEPKWRARNSLPTQVPWMSHTNLTHPDVGFSLTFNWFMWRLTGDSRYKTESDTVYSSHLEDVVTIDSKEVFPLGMNHQVAHAPGHPYYELLETGYLNYVAMYLITAYLEGNTGITETRLSRIANSITTYVLDNGTSDAAQSIGGDEDRGGYLVPGVARLTGTQYYIGMMHLLAYWDTTGKIQEYTERFYNQYKETENSLQASIGMLTAYQLGRLPVARGFTATLSSNNAVLAWTLPERGAYSAWDNVIVFHGTSPGSLTQLTSLSMTSTTYTHTSLSEGFHYYAVALKRGATTGIKTVIGSVEYIAGGA